MHHSKSHFYKYLSTNAVKAVLTNKSVKWSSPILFNDPFDMPTKFDFDFSGAELAEALLEEQVRLVFSDEEPAGNIDHPLFAMILLSRKI